MTVENGRRLLRLVSFKELRKGGLLGFATVEMAPGLTIADCPVQSSHGRVWCGLPAKPVLDPDGRQAEVSGKRQYTAILANSPIALATASSRSSASNTPRRCCEQANLDLIGERNRAAFASDPRAPGSSSGQTLAALQAGLGLSATEEPQPATPAPAENEAVAA
jgi:hypothetical protein